METNRCFAFTFIAKHQQKQSPLAPKVWNPSPLRSLPYVSKGNFEDCECRFHWSSFGLLSPVLKPLNDFAKDWSIPRSENGFFFPLFLAGTVLFLWISFWFNERVDPELLYIFLTRLMHSANSFFLNFLSRNTKEYHLTIHTSIQL